MNKKIIKIGLSVLISILIIMLIAAASVYWIWGDILRIHALADVIGWDNIRSVSLKEDKLNIEIYMSYGYPQDNNGGLEERNQLQKKKEQLSNIKNQILEINEFINENEYYKKLKISVGYSEDMPYPNPCTGIKFRNYSREKNTGEVEKYTEFCSLVLSGGFYIGFDDFLDEPWINMREMIFLNGYYPSYPEKIQYFTSLEYLSISHQSTYETLCEYAPWCEIVLR